MKRRARSKTATIPKEPISAAPASPPPPLSPPEPPSPEPLPRWSEVNPAHLPDPRVNEESSEFGKRFVPGFVGVDADGQLWELDWKYNAKLIGRPPKT